jgi:hypothetical protein
MVVFSLFLIQVNLYYYKVYKCTMKKIFLSIFFTFILQIGFAQKAYKWRASDYSSRLSYNNGQSWGSWSDWTTSGVLIVAQDQRVNVYSATPQVYDMIETVTKSYDSNNNPIFSVMCVDENGTRCKMIWYHSARDGSYVIFEFSNLELMYKVVSLD